MNQFTLKEIRQCWEQKSYDSTQALIRWNNDAAHFGAKEMPTMDHSLCLQLLANEGVLFRGGKGLDVGCGGGQYSLALEQYGYTMHGTDFSPNMILEADKNKALSHSAATFSVDDWHTLDLREKGWYKKFDLVLAHMTPAVIDGETFEKLIDASKGYVFLQKPTRRQNQLFKEIRELLGAEDSGSSLDESFAEAFSMAWLMGYSPKTGYKDTVWTSKMTIDEAVSDYLGRLGRSYTEKPGDEEKVRKYLQERFPDGEVEDITRTHLAAMVFHC